jgi:hypothetical protein
MERADPPKCFPGDRRLATIGDLVVNHEAGAAGCPEFTPKTNRYPNGRLADRARFEPMVAVR